MAEIAEADETEKPRVTDGGGVAVCSFRRWCCCEGVGVVGVGVGVGVNVEVDANVDAGAGA